MKNAITDSVKENPCEISTPKLKNTLYISPTEPIVSIIKDNILHRKRRKKVKFVDSESVSIYGPPPIYESVNTKDIIKDYVTACEKLKTKPLDCIISQLGEYEVIQGRLPHLNLNGVRIDFKSAESLEPIFVSVQTEKLFLENTISDESACETLCGIIAFYSSVYALSIGSNTRIGLRGWSAISDMVSRSSELVELNLNRMIFTEQSVEPLSKALRKSQSLHLGIKHICNALIKSEVTGLEVLKLWNTSLTSIGMHYLSDYLRIKQFGHKPITFTSLNLGKNKIGDDGLLALKHSLIQNNSLRRLGLASTKLSPTGVIALAEIIADNKSLIRVDLRDNNINMAGVLALSQALKHNMTMLKINFSSNFKIDSGMEMEFKHVIHEISMKCNENLDKARSCGKIEDNLSIYSAISHEAVTTNSAHPSAFPSMTSVFMHFITSPWRLPKFKMFNSNKTDAEKIVDTSGRAKETECVDKKKKMVGNGTPKNSSSYTLPRPLDKKETFLPLPPNTYTVSRFQVSHVRNPKPTHRRSRSENLCYKSTDIISDPNSLGKLNTKDTQNIDSNVTARNSMSSYQSQDNVSISSISSS
ncbi:hypothetical protein MXB_4064, partial [Myxobolus squamalis]